jgi:hypothetical protein
MTFSASETAFEGFRLIRREPRTFLIWGAVAAVFGLVSFGAMYATGMQKMFAQMSSLPAGGGNPGAYLGGLFGFLIVMFGLALLIYSVVICGVYRTVLRPEEKGFARLRLGADEGRMALLIVIMGLLWLAAWIVIVIALAIIGAVVGISAGAGPSPGAAGGMVLVMLLIYLVALLFGFWFAVQFSMAAPMSFAERRITVFKSMRVVKGHFWKLLGCFALLAVITCLLYVVVGSLQLALNLAVGGPNPYAAIMHPGEQPDLSRMFSPGAIAVSILVQFVAVLFYPIWFAPQASAYRQLTGGEARAAEAFD